MKRDIEIIPYVKIDNRWTISDEIIYEMFGQIIKDGLFKILFFDGIIKTKNDFLAFMQRKTNNVIAIYDDGPLGLVWTQFADTGSLWLHFLIFKRGWGVKTKFIGKKVLKYFFGLKISDENYLIEVISGIVPHFNKYALNYLDELGCQTIGIIPNFYYDSFSGNRMDGVIKCMTREIYNASKRN